MSLVEGVSGVWVVAGEQAGVVEVVAAAVSETEQSAEHLAAVGRAGSFSRLWGWSPAVDVRSGGAV